MKKIYIFLMCLPMLVGSSVAQTDIPAAAIHRTNSEEVDYILARLEPRILAVGEAMPTDKYSFAPNQGEFKGVRTFAEHLKHIAANNYLDGAAILGENPPGNIGPGESGSTAVQTKPEIIAYVKDSFEYVRRAVRKIDDGNAAIPNPAFLPYGPSVTSRMHIILANIGHTNDHYGQLVEYLRMNGIIPPESRPENGSGAGQALDFWISNTEKEVVSSADAMPGEKYSFAPTAGEFTRVRTFAEQIKHLAANNYRMAARMLGQTPTPDQEAETGPDAVRSKPEILDYLEGSFAALHRSAATVTAENAFAPVLPNRVGTAGQNTRVQFAIDAVAHSYDHYGQMVEYLRMNGIVPPASRR
jgi:hypothetical protein